MKNIITWNEETDEIEIRPTEENIEGCFYQIQKISICEFRLKWMLVQKTMSTLEGIVQYLGDDLDKDDCITLCGLFYAWGRLHGAKQ